MQALRAAARDGVDVRLLVPGRGSDIALMQAISRAGYRPLLEAGVRVFEWNGPMLHAKTAVADARWARVGSTNLNLASWIGNRELDVVIEDEGVRVRDGGAVPEGPREYDRDRAEPAAARARRGRRAGEAHTRSGGQRRTGGGRRPAHRKRPRLRPHRAPGPGPRRAPPHRARGPAPPARWPSSELSGPSSSPGPSPRSAPGSASRCCGERGDGGKRAPRTSAARGRSLRKGKGDGFQDTRIRAVPSPRLTSIRAGSWAASSGMWVTTPTMR